MPQSSEQVSIIEPDIDLFDVAVDETSGMKRSSMDAQMEKGQGSLPTERQLPPERDMEGVRQAVEAFNQDLDGLLKAKKLHHIVAYVGGERVAIAPSHRKLHKQLDRMPDLQRSKLFVACVTPRTNDDDCFMSR